MDDQITNVVNDIVKAVNNDPNLNDEMRDEILDLAQAAEADPTPGNLKALSIVFDKLSEANKYMGAMTSLRDLQVDNMIEKQEMEDSSTQPTN